MKKDNRRRPQGQSNNNKKKKNGKNAVQDNRLNGFSTLNQVTGVPKPHSFHSRIPLLPVQTVKETGDVCAICGRKIDTIAAAMLSPEGQTVHFDCVLDQLKKDNPVRDNQTISYVGKGSFAICEKGEDGKWTIVSRIQYETPEANQRFREYVGENKV